MIVSMSGSETMGTGMTTVPWVWVRVRVLHVKKSRVRIRDQVHMGTSFRIQITMGTGMGKLGYTTSLVEPFEKLGYRFVHEGRLCRISF